MSRILLAAALSALAACGPGPEAMPAKPPKPEAPAAEPGLLVTPAAVGPATRTTPFDRHALQRLFRGADVSAEFHDEEGEPTPVVMVLGPELSIEFHGRNGTVSRAFVRGGDVRGPKGERIGDRFSALGFGEAQCIAGADRLGGTRICRRPGAPQLGFVFAPADAADPVLREFYWLADGL